MKIALVCPASLPATQFGGIMFLFIHLAKHISNLGNDVTIYTTDLDFANNVNTFNRKLPREEKIENFLIKRTHVWISIYLFFVNPGMYKQMLNDNFDIIHSIGVRSFQSIIAAIISKKKKIPLIISDQGGLTTHPDIKKSSFFKKLLIKFQNIFLKLIINQASKIIVANEYEKNIFLNFCDEKKIVIISNGIDLNEIYSSKIDFKSKYDISKNYLLFLGRFHIVKGIDILIEAIDIIKHNLEEKNIQVILMGVNFGYEKELLNLIKIKNLSHIITVIKNPSREDVLAAYKQSEFLILPSRWELSPLTPLEGFAFKKTVISTNAHGIPFTLENEKNSILVEPENSFELAQSVLRLLNDKKLAQKFGESGYKLVHTTRNSDYVIKRVFQEYQSII